MFPVIAAFEVMDKEPPIWLILLCFLSTGALGMLVARRRPILGLPFISVALLGAFAIYLELRDPYVGDAILSEGGLTYVLGCGFAILVGIGMPLLGAFVGARKIERDMTAWRWTLGVSRAVIAGLTLFTGSGFVEAAYYNYIIYPTEKAGEGYIMPLRWQDIVAELSIASVLIALLLLSAYLVRSAFSPKSDKSDEISVKS